MAHASFFSRLRFSPSRFSPPFFSLSRSSLSRIPWSRAAHALSSDPVRLLTETSPLTALTEVLELHPLRYALTPVQARLADLGLTGGQQVLELGGGKGFLVPGILEGLGETGQLTFAEPVQIKLEHVREQHGSDPRLTLVPCGWPGELPEGPFDLILLHHVFHLVKDRGGLVRELRQRLREGGRVGLWEARGHVPYWRVRSWEGMFLGQGFEVEARIESPLGHGCRFRAV